LKSLNETNDKQNLGVIVSGHADNSTEDSTTQTQQEHGNGNDKNHGNGNGHGKGHNKP
jgi:hypothetical protein